MNAARDLAATGTPGPWETWKMPDEGPSKWTMHGVAVPGDEMGHRGEFMFADDAEKATCAVNALPAWADYDDAVMAYLKHQTGCHIPTWCPDLARLWREFTAARDAVAAALTGETP